MIANFIALFTLLFSIPNKFWKWLRWLWFKFFPVSYHLAFSIKSEEGLNSGNYYKEIIRQIEENIKLLNLDKVIKMKDYSDIHIFKNNEEVHNYIIKNNISLMIWGNFSTDNLKIKDKIINDINLKFTFRTPADSKNIFGKIILTDVFKSTSISETNWSIWEDNSYYDINNISNNLIDISLYILALSLKAFLKIKESNALLERIYEKNNQPNSILKDSIKNHLINNYNILIDLLHFKIIKLSNVEVIHILQKTISLNPKDIIALNNLALFYFLEGNIEKSRACVKEAYIIDINYPTSLVNLAFFSLLDGDYNEANKLYQRLTKYDETKIAFNPLDVIDFLSQRYKETKNPAFLFGSGFMSYYYGDKRIVKKDLSDFLKKADSIRMKKMIKTAKKLLRNL